MYQVLHGQIRDFLIQYANSIDDGREALDRHRPILNAIIDQDVEAARQLGRDHAEICASYVKKINHRNGEEK
jgi:DNA-binding GntR family transcriptional regulator